MIHRDWFKRQLEVIVQALGTVLGLKAEGEVQTAAAAVEAAVQKAFGMSSNLALGLRIEDFLTLACRGEEPTAEFLSGMAKLFAEWAGLLDAQGRPAEAALSKSRSQTLADLAQAKAGTES
ncbi:MAG: hypothetical protein HY924_11550 [Elusimicrobia bacterium]|nr:hypothetical protein [Elusimicrobiota bacterium]